MSVGSVLFFFNDTATTEIYTLSLHDALPISTTGSLDPPEAMRPWIERSFGSVEAVREQRIVKVTNRVTLQGTLFNGLRASRPLDTGVSLDLEREIEATARSEEHKSELQSRQYLVCRLLLEKKQ